MRILMLDNYDSFTYNLVHIIHESGFGEELEVYRNDAISLDQVTTFDKIILSPGPGVPADAGIMPQIIKVCSPTHPILGVCLGHQAIAENFGGQLKLLDRVKHGIESELTLLEHEGIFKGIPQACRIGHYHSWYVGDENFPEELRVTARDRDGNIMALQHKKHPCTGVQFHPESVLTPYGKKMIENWLKG